MKPKKKLLSFTVGGNAKSYSHFARQFVSLLQNSFRVGIYIPNCVGKSMFTNKPAHKVLRAAIYS